MEEQIVRFDIIMPLYNKSAYVADTIKSILRQKHTHFRLIIVDDGSTDNSVNIVQQFTDSRIHLIHKENGGVSSARNHGILFSSAEWIALIDADDNWEDNHLMLMSQAIHKFPDAGIIYACYNQPMYLKYQNHPLLEPVVDFSSILCNMEICSSSICCRRDNFLKAGLFNERISLGEDIDMWSRLSTLGPQIVRINQKTATYNNKDNSGLSSRVLPPEKHFGYYVYSPQYEYNHLKNIRKLIRRFMLSLYASSFKLHYILRCILNTPTSKLSSDIIFLFFQFPFLYLIARIKTLIKNILRIN